MKKFLGSFTGSAPTAPSAVFFGAPLDAILAREEPHESPDDADVPDILKKFVEFLSSEKALRNEGLFRLAGSVKFARELRERIERTGVIDFSDVQPQDIVTVASLMKKWILELPGRLIPESYYSDMENAAGCAEDIRDVLGELPPANLATLRYICRYLLLVASHEHENRMSIQNLARVFAPNIFRCPSEPPEGTLPSAEHLAYLAETLVVGKILQFILEHFDEVFGAVGDWYVGWASLFSAGGLEAMHVGPDRKAGSHKSGPGKLISVPPNVLKSSEAPDLFFTSLEHPFGDDDGDKGPAKSIVENTTTIEDPKAESAAQQSILSKLSSMGGSLFGKGRKRSPTLTEKPADPATGHDGPLPVASTEPGNVAQGKKAMIDELKNRLAQNTKPKSFDEYSQSSQFDESDDESDASSSSKSEDSRTVLPVRRLSTFQREAVQLAKEFLTRSKTENPERTEIKEESNVPSRPQPLVLPTKGRARPPARNPRSNKVDMKLDTRRESRSVEPLSSDDAEEPKVEAPQKPALTSPDVQRPPYDRRKSVSFQLPVEGKDDSSLDVPRLETDERSADSESTDESSEASETSASSETSEVTNDEEEEESVIGTQSEEEEIPISVPTKKPAPNRPAPPPPVPIGQTLRNIDSSLRSSDKPLDSATERRRRNSYSTGIDDRRTQRNQAESTPTQQPAQNVLPKTGDFRVPLESSLPELKHIERSYRRESRRSSQSLNNSSETHPSPVQAPTSGMEMDPSPHGADSSLSTAHDSSNSPNASPRVGRKRPEGLSIRTHVATPNIGRQTPLSARPSPLRQQYVRRRDSVSARPRSTADTPGAITPITPLSAANQTMRLQDTSTILQSSPLRNQAIDTGASNDEGKGKYTRPFAGVSRSVRRQRSHTLSDAQQQRNSGLDLSAGRQRSATMNGPPPPVTSQQLQDPSQLHEELQYLHRKIKEAKRAGASQNEYRSDLVRYKEIREIIQSPRIARPISASATSTTAPVLPSPNANISSPTSPAIASLNRLLESRARAHRPERIERMSDSQVAQEKAELKTELRHLDTLYKRNGKSEEDDRMFKELCQRYLALKGRLEPVKAEASQRRESKVQERKRRSVDDEERRTYERLRHEKKVLQLWLHEFREGFTQKHGRPVSTAEDRAPVKEEFRRYKELRTKLSQIEAAMDSKTPL